MAYYADASGSFGYTIRGVVEDSSPQNACSNASSPLAADPLTCPCGAGVPVPAFAFEAGGVARGCRRPIGPRSAEFRLRVAVASLNATAAASAPADAAAASAVFFNASSASLAPWLATSSPNSSAFSSAALSASTAVSGLTALGNRRFRTDYWCTLSPWNASSASPALFSLPGGAEEGFAVPSKYLRALLLATGGTTASTAPTANILGMDASGWAGCVAPKCGPSGGYVPGSCTVVGLPAGAAPNATTAADQFALFRAPLAPQSTVAAGSALSGGNCSFLGNAASADALLAASSSSPPPSTAEVVQWVACRYNPLGAQVLAVNVSVSAAAEVAGLEQGTASAAVAGVSTWSPASNTSSSSSTSSSWSPGGGGGPSS